MSRFAGAGRAVALAGVVVAAVWGLLPAGVWWAGWSRDYYATSWALWGWGGLLALLLAAAALALTRGRAVDALARGWALIMAVSARRFPAAAALVLAALAVVSAVVLMNGNPRNVDGFAQLFQARIFLAGRLWLPPPPDLAHFATLQMIVGPERWYAQYPPGQSLVLAAGLLAGAWWLLNPLFAAGLALATYRVARWAAGEAEARGALLVLCLSPFVLAMAGSEMSHLAAAALGMGAAAAATAAGGAREWRAAAGTGILLALMAAFRPLDAVAAAVPAAVILLLVAARPVRAFAVTGIAGALASFPVFAWNRATTGGWLRFGYTELWGPQHSLGFHDVPWGTPLTPLRALGLTGLDLHQINAYLVDLPAPVLLVAALGFLAGRRRLGARDAVPVLGAAALFGLLFFYWHRDVFYGPRLHFSAVPWIVILLARGSALLVTTERPVVAGRPAGAVLGSVLAAGLVVGLVALLPSRLRAYRDSAPIFALHPDRDAAQANITHAVVVIPDGWGTRLITRMWAAGIPVWRSSRLYAAVDACALELALRPAESDPAARVRLGAVLDSLAALGETGRRFSVTDDVNLRLPRADSLLAPECREEIEFDRRGFLQFAPFLWLNAAGLDGTVVWARDLGPRNAALFARHAGRRYYRYAPPAGGSRPTFTPLAADGVTAQ